VNITKGQVGLIIAFIACLFFVVSVVKSKMEDTIVEYSAQEEDIKVIIRKEEIAHAKSPKDIQIVWEKRLKEGGIDINRGFLKFENDKGDVMFIQRKGAE
jgi:hypothetical protein